MWFTECVYGRRVKDSFTVAAPERSFSSIRFAKVDDLREKVKSRGSFGHEFSFLIFFLFWSFIKRNEEKSPSMVNKISNIYFSISQYQIINYGKSMWDQYEESFKGDSSFI